MMPTLVLYLFFQAQGLKVGGVVSDPSGRPVQGARVACGTETETTNARGEFELAQPCDATITKPGFAPAKVAIAASKDNQITLALAPASERVIVTATGSPVALEDAGVAADVFTAKDFEAPHTPFVADLLRDDPGLSVVQSGQNGALISLFVRGGDSDAALVLLDGIPITEPGGSMDFSHLTSAGLDRMEVIRGPESALFGAEASSAVIQMFTAHGDPEATMPHGSLVYDRGSFSTDHWSASLNGGLAKRIDYAFTTDQFRSTGEFTNSAFRVTTGTVNLGFRISDKTQVRAVYREFDSYTGDPGQTAYGLVDPNATETARDSALSLRLDDARSKRFVQRVLFGYHRYRDRFMDYNTETYNIAAILRTVPGPSYPYTYLVALANPNNPTAPPGTFFVDSPQTLYPSPGLTLTDRTNLNYQGTFTHRGGALVFGYEYERQAGIISETNVERHDNGFFVNDQYALTPRIVFNAGARLQQSSTFGTEFTPRGAVTFRLPTDTYFRLSAARGIKEPELIDNFANESFYVGNPSLKPETTDSYRGWSLPRMVLRARAHRSLVLQEFLQRSDRVRFLPKSGDLDKYRSQLGARRGAFGFGPSWPDLSASAAPTLSCILASPMTATQHRSASNWSGVRKIPDRSLWSFRRGAGPSTPARVSWAKGRNRISSFLRLTGIPVTRLYISVVPGKLPGTSRRLCASTMRLTRITRRFWVILRCRAPQPGECV